MSKSSGKPEPTGYPEYGVKAEMIRGFFSPPLPTSTFHDQVNKGLIILKPGLRGFFKLNESLRRLGLREVPRPPQDVPSRTTEDITRLAFHLIDPELFPAPSWLLNAEVIDRVDIRLNPEGILPKTLSERKDDCIPTTFIAYISRDPLPPAQVPAPGRSARVQESSQG